MVYIDVKEAAKLWNITERRVTSLCRDGKIPGAEKVGKIWKIPNNAKKPSDKRTLTEIVRLPLPVGISDFKKAATDYYYVDKTLLIKDIIDTKVQVSLFTRPRRFGKTLNMDMLRVFFEKTDDDTSAFFKDKLIWSCGDKYQKEQGKYPVIFLSFKDVKYSTWEETFNHIGRVIQREFGRHSEILKSPACADYEKEYFNKVLSFNATETDLQLALSWLSQMLDEVYGIAPIIIIDEYDTPIQQGYMRSYYEKIILFMRNLFSGGFKDNHHLSFGFLTGILRVAKESIFSGMNNLKENSVMDDRFSEYFGFTDDEVLDLLRYYKQSDKYEEVNAWYDGYLFGQTKIFNPWSVINYIDSESTPSAYWQSTGNNDIIRQIVADANDEIKNNLQYLMQGKSISAYIDTAVIYPEIKNNPSTVYSFLLMAGYLKINTKTTAHDGAFICELSIPNKEIFYVYGKEILSALSNTIAQSTAIAIQKAIIGKDIPALKTSLNEYLEQTISVFDTGEEIFYQGLMLGLYAIMNNLYEVTSNRESGDGRYDIQMLPIDLSLPGIIVELKVLRDYKGNDINVALTDLSEKALCQIEDKNYTSLMITKGIKNIMKFGIAFHKKYVQIAYREN